MMPEPFKSALSIGDVEDTSLAVPPDRKLRSPQERVLEQVHTIKRSKSKTSSKSVSGLLSPVSPESDSVFYDFKFSPGGSLSGPSFSRGAMTNGAMQKKGFMHQSTNSHSFSGQRVTTGPGRINRTFYSTPGPLPTQTQTNNNLYSYKSTRSAPDLGFQSTGNVGATTTTQRTQISRQNIPRVPNTQHAQAYRNGIVPRIPNSNQASNMQQIVRRPSSLQSNGDSRFSMIRNGQAKDISGMNAENIVSDITMRDAVDYLYSTDESYQQFGAAHIQHSTFTDDKAKQEVLTLKGIPPLVNLLKSPSPKIKETVAAALRNLVFQNQANKEEVQHCGGIPQAVQLLDDTNSETQKHLTGLLWNLSSVDKLKPDLLRTALPTLTTKVIEPFSASTDDNSTSLALDVFNNATGCLRNLSSDKPMNRQAMRSCKGLIDALMRYTEKCVNAQMPDNQSLENCVCILHNLTYQLEIEMPSLFNKINMMSTNARNHSSSSDAGPIGCFSSQSQKLLQESGFDYPVMEDNNPKGVGWLFHSKALKMYLDLLSSSGRDATREASCGALQNLTATAGTVSNVLSHTIVKKLNGLKYISPLLQSPNPALQKSAVALLGNLSRSTPTNTTMARQVLPQLVGFLNSGLKQDDTSPGHDSSMATALHSTHALLKADPEISKSMLNNSLISSLQSMSTNLDLPKSSTAAGYLLYSMWSEMNIQSFLKKQGMNKKLFVNEKSLAAFRSFQVVD